jgi:hypothetical protein
MDKGCLSSKARWRRNTIEQSEMEGVCSSGSARWMGRHFMWSGMSNLIREQKKKVYHPSHSDSKVKGVEVYKGRDGKER